MTSGDLIIDLSENMIEIISNDLDESFRLLFFRVFPALLVFELLGGHFDPPPTRAKVAQRPTRARVKQALSSAPVVSFPRFSAGAGRFRLDTDASDLGIGATLFQEQDGEDRVIAYASQKLCKSQRNYSTTRKKTFSLCCIHPAF